MDIEVLIAFKALLFTLRIVKQKTLLDDEEPKRGKRRKAINSY